jgi:molybdate transport system permease protein
MHSPRRSSRVVVIAATAALLLLILLPIAAIVWRGAPALTGTLVSPSAREAIRLTLLTSTISLVGIVALGTPPAWLIARRGTRVWRLIDALIDLPVVLPPSVAGIGLLQAFGRNGLLGPALDAFGVQVPFTTAAVVVAQIFVAAPLFVRAAVIGLRRVDDDLESVAQVDGATRWQTFRFITLPLSASALLTGAALAWARAIGEFGATILFAGNIVGRTQTIALAIYLEFQTDTTAALGLALLLLITTVVLQLAIRYLSRDDVG